MAYRVTVKLDGQWQRVVRGFETLDGASQWAAEVLETGQGVGVTGYRVEEEGGKVVCSVER